MAATERPWINGQNHHPLSENYLAPALSGQDERVAIAVFPDANPNQADDAAYTLRTVNLHDELVAACAGLVELLEAHNWGEGPALRAARSVLKKAEEQRT